MCLRYKIQNLITSLKWRFQRFKKGYADIDVWNFNDWFLETIPKMLMELKEELNGYPIDMKPEDWEKYLQEMINHFEIAYTIDDVDYDILESTLQVECKNIEYDLDEDELDFEEVKNLPTELTVTVTVEDRDDIEDAVKDAIAFENGSVGYYPVKSLDYKILKQE